MAIHAQSKIHINKWLDFSSQMHTRFALLFVLRYIYVMFTKFKTHLKQEQNV